MANLLNNSDQYECFRNKTGEEPTTAQKQQWANQAKIVFTSFFQSPKTMYMVEKETGIMRPSICRFVAEWRKKDSIRIVKTDKDPYTKCQAQFLTTNPMHWPKADTVKVNKFGQTLMFQ